MVRRPRFMRKPTFKGLKQSRTARALRDFVSVEFSETDPEVRDPVDRGIKRTRVYMQRIFDGIQSHRGRGKEVFKRKIMGNVRSSREFVFGELLGSDYRPRHRSRSRRSRPHRRLKRKVVK